MACSYCRQSGHNVSYRGITRCPQKIEDERIQSKGKQVEEVKVVETVSLNTERHYSPVSVLTLNTDASLRLPEVKNVKDLTNYAGNLCRSTNASIVTCTESIKGISRGFEDHFSYVTGSESSSSNIMTFWDTKKWEVEKPCYWSFAGRFLATNMEYKPENEEEEKFSVLHLSIHMHKVYINKKTTAFNLLQKYLDDNTADSNFIYACGDWNSTKEEIKSKLGIKLNFGLNGEATTKAGNSIDNIVTDVASNDIHAKVLTTCKAFSHFPIVGNTIFKL